MGLRPMCCGISLGNNSSPLPTLPSDGTGMLISTVTVTVNEPSDAVGLIVSIWSDTSSSTVVGTPLQANVIRFNITRTSDNFMVRDVQNTDFDEMTTTFTAIDMPGTGTFTYTLFGNIVRSTSPGQNENILDVTLTAETLNIVS
ncbi:hypothetical protein KHA96_20720 [Bacillus sp. FJAT-49711]|uniref:hypothetical protein n=1 Tax=Bacillus sp. FJAT-49711 TaxID=2833585 RepID=UPI001BC91B46|nr:hypothetical protein [Bacillus sp. FJAT-49711]MBS4220726.1 hypothetical protein [Bacillus sp. FJAT-49711]